MNTSSWKLDYDFKQLQSKLFESASKFAEDFNLDRLQTEEDLEQPRSDSNAQETLSSMETKEDPLGQREEGEVIHHDTAPVEQVENRKVRIQGNFVDVSINDHDELEDLSFNDLMNGSGEVITTPSMPVTAATSEVPSTPSITQSQRWLPPPTTTPSTFFDDDLPPEQDPIWSRFNSQHTSAHQVHHRGLLSSAASSISSSITGVTSKLFRSNYNNSSHSSDSSITSIKVDNRVSRIPANVVPSGNATSRSQGSSSPSSHSSAIVPLCRAALLKLWDNLGSNNVLVLLSVLLLWSTYYKFGRHATETGDN